MQEKNSSERRLRGEKREKRRKRKEKR